MSRYQTILTVIVAAATALSLAAPLRAGADPGGSSSVHEYVVVYAEGPPAAESAIRKAGGRIVDVNERLGVAKVATTDRGFVTKARRAAGIRSVVLNHAIGTSKPGMPHRFAAERPTRSDKSIGARAGKRNEDARRSTEPLSNMQWNMTMMDADQAHERATGRGVDVGIIDTGIDGTHPDLATNFDQSRSRNFTQDIPAIDGPCENPTCIDPANTDGDGHGTHVAGIVAADDDRFGIGGVAPDATLVNLRAGQDSGYFFLYETVAALVEAGDLQLDVVNMSFYTDPWMYNCASRADYISGDVTDEEVAQQATTRQLVLNAVSYAHDRGVTLLAAAGNDHTNLATPIREDLTSPDYPPGSERRRVVTNNCLDLPAEAPQVISVSAVGPSTTKADYSNYGYGDVEVSAPGGWFRDTFGTPTFQVPSNLILSAYPLELAIEQELADENGVPTDDFSVQYCTRGVCGFYTYLQGTSMASPHAAGVAALIIDRYGRATGRGGKALDPEVVRRILEESAVDHRCPAGGVEDYTQEGRPADWNAACEGTTDENGFYGEGIVNAARAVAASPQHLS